MYSAIVIIIIMIIIDNHNNENRVHCTYYAVICTLYFYTLKHNFKQSRAMNVVVYIEHCLVCSLKRGNQKW